MSTCHRFWIFCPAIFFLFVDVAGTFSGFLELNEFFFIVTMGFLRGYLRSYWTFKDCQGLFGGVGGGVSGGGFYEEYSS